MKNKILFLFAIACCLMAFAQTNLTGKWVGYLMRPNSTDTATFTYDLHQSNDVLTGAIIGPDGGSVDIDSGKVAGNHFSFSITEADRLEKITGTYYSDSLGTDIALPSGHKLHMTMMRSR